MKDSRLFATLAIVFIAGFLLGVVFSAWKLDAIMSTAKPAPQAARESAQDDVESRIAGLEKMLAVAPNNVEVLVQLGNDYFDKGKTEKALETFRKALELQPTNPDVATIMGVTYRRLGKPNEAIKYFKKAVEIKPDHTMALFNLGIIYGKELNDPAEELKAWETFLEKAGDNPHTAMVRQRVEQLKKGTGKAK